MTSLELFSLLGSIRPENLIEAERLQFTAVPLRKKHKKRALWVLVAAVLSLLLVGCAVAYLLSIQDLQVGQRQTSRWVFDEHHREVIGTEPVSQQVLTFSGLQGSPSYQGAQEWFSFLEGYDPEGTIQKQAFQGDPEVLFPDTYDAYFIYSQEMEDKLEELAAKYNLKLMGRCLDFETVSGLTEALGIDHILLPKSKVTAYLDDGKCYQAGNFQISMELYMPQKKGEWPYTIQALLRYCRKDVLSPDFAYLNKDESWKQWNYRSASGKNILILRATEGDAYLFCDCGDATLTLSFESGDNPDTDMTDYPFTWMTDQQVEEIADAIDFTVSPRLPEENTGKPVSHPKGWEIETKSVDFDGCFGRIVFHLTAPWGTKLLCGDAGYVYPENSNLLIPETGSFDMKAWTVDSEDDGDGKKNTVDIVFHFALETVDDPVFSQGNKWKAHLADLTQQETKPFRDELQVIAKGVWEPEVSFAGADLRKIECLEKPIRVTDGGEVITLESIQLRRMGVIFRTSGNVRLPTPTLIMEDGTEVLWETGGASPGITCWLAEKPIDLDRVKSIRFEDGTEILVEGKTAE